MSSSIPEPMFRPATNWPLILVGPIVRRVTDTSVAVFVATSRPCRVKLNLYQDTSPAAVQLSAEHEAPTRILGARLHAVVVEVTGVSGLARDHVYGYDLTFMESGQSPRTLEGLGLLQDDPDESVLALGYEFHHRPGFCLPGPLARLRMVHCSCRKAHGGGLDMLPAVDTLIEQSRTGSTIRPQQLFLTGDQIYADDVATALLHTLREVGYQLLGWEEQLPRRAGGSVSRHHADVDLVQRSKRFLVPELGKPDTHYAANHLLFLGEWLAMYAMCWSPVLWKRASGPSLFGFELPSSLLWPSPREGEGDTTPAVLEMAELLPKTRRALANVATFMIFDDHEVTDDWYLNGLLDLRFRSAPAGRRMLRNALLAYAVFQDWGNKPEEYAAGTLGEQLIGRLGGQAPFDLTSIVTDPESCDEILDIQDSRLVFNQRGRRMRWDYEVIGPQHRVIVLDTRTWRYFPELDPSVTSAANTLVTAARSSYALSSLLLQTAAKNMIAGYQKLNAALISEDAMQMQIDARLGDTSKQLFVISAAPVITFPMVDLVQRTFILGTSTDTRKLREEGEEKWENEPWMGNHAAFRSLMARLADTSVVFLSGDVHYGYTADAVFEDRDTTGAQWSSRYLQLCSSAARNATSANRLLTAIDWLGDPARERSDNASTFAEIATGYAVFPSGSGLVPSAYQDFRNEVIADVEAERQHMVTALSTHEDYGEIWQALFEGRVIGAGWEVTEWYLTEQMLTALKLLKDRFNPFETFLGDFFFAAPGRASQLKQSIVIAMHNHNIPSLLEWSIGSTFSYDYRGGARLVRPPWISAADWNAVAGPNVYTMRTPYERLNYCSVADSTVGVIEFESADGTGYRLVHEMLWCHDQSALTQQDWCTTRHVLDLAGTGLLPWSQLPEAGE